EEVVEAFDEVRQFSFQVVSGTFVALIAYFGEMTMMFVDTFRTVLKRGTNWGDLVRQMTVIGVESLPIALLTVGFSSAVLALYTITSLVKYGAADIVGGIVAIAVVRETGPLLTGISIAARAGSAITAEIGSMKVSEQIDALRSMAISPAEYLVAPRLLACLIMFPVMTVFSNVAGIAGGAIVASANGIAFPAFKVAISQFLDEDGSDIWKGLLKTLFFGGIVALVGCREGLDTEGGATGVGRATTRSVVIAIVLIFVADFILTFLLFAGKGIL
ncbi:MAG: ABC transporter permease, partial [Armatimonadetes bacterium]|nr:ABC transporter permease [Armatimonadota bacterium]